MGEQLIQPLSISLAAAGRLVTCTAVIQGSFKVRYPVTAMVKGKSRVKVTISISVDTGCQWLVFAKFVGVIEKKIYIPPKPEAKEEEPVSSSPSEQPSQGYA